MPGSRKERSNSVLIPGDYPPLSESQQKLVLCHRHLAWGLARTVENLLDDARSRSEWHLCRAASSWQPTRSEFSTYAWWVVRRGLWYEVMWEKWWREHQAQPGSTFEGGDDSWDNYFLDTAPGPDLEALAGEEIEWMLGLFGEDGELVERHLLLGVSQGVIALEEGVSHQAISLRYRTAIRRVQQSLEV